MYFKDKQNEYLFYILELHGKTRMDKLKISMMHYHGKRAAKEWYDEILSIISADKNHEMYTKGVLELEEIYKGMIVA